MRGELSHSLTLYSSPVLVNYNMRVSLKALKGEQFEDITMVQSTSMKIFVERSETYYKTSKC